MTPESFAKLTLLKQIIGQMSLAEKMSFVADVRSKLPPEALKTSDGQHTYTEENILAVALLMLVADDRDEFQVRSVHDSAFDQRRVEAGREEKEHDAAADDGRPAGLAPPPQANRGIHDERRAPAIPPRS